MVLCWMVVDIIMIYLDYNSLDVPNDVKELFLYIQRYKPHKIELETTLKCFIPSYIPAIGGPNTFPKVPWSDGTKDGLAIQVIDKQLAPESDATVIKLQLRALSKKVYRQNDCSKHRTYR